MRLSDYKIKKIMRCLEIDFKELICYKDYEDNLKEKFFDVFDLLAVLAERSLLKRAEIYKVCKQGHFHQSQTCCVQKFQICIKYVFTQLLKNRNLINLHNAIVSKAQVIECSTPFI